MIRRNCKSNECRQSQLLPAQKTSAKDACKKTTVRVCRKRRHKSSSLRRNAVFPFRPVYNNLSLASGQ